MKSASITFGAGPGSSITLSPESIRVRDAIIEKFIDKSLDELNDFLGSALDTERDENKRIGILAARVFILRTRINKIVEFNQNPMIPAISDLKPYELISKNKDDAGNESTEDLETHNNNELEEWNELIPIEAGEVNGVRIPKGVNITVGKADAERLIHTGKAQFIAENNENEEATSETTSSDSSENNKNLLNPN